MYNISNLQRQQLTVQYQQLTQAAVECTISATYKKQPLTVQYQQPTQRVVNCTITSTYTGSN